MKKKIAVLGGGIGSLSTVFALTSTPGWQDRYEITVYQQGWRLGGKGASGRNRKLGHRIEEHGFHMWMGFYHNAFRTMRECYDERLRVMVDPGVFRTWQDAYEPQRLNVLVEHVGGQWKLWPITYADRPGEPGVDSPHHSPWQHVLEIIEWLRGRVHEIPGVVGRARAAVTHPQNARQRLRDRLATPLHVVEDLAKIGALELAAHLAEKLGTDITRHSHDDHTLLVECIDHERKRFVADLQHVVDQSDQARRLLIALELGAALLRGVIADRVMFRGFEALDDEEFRAWLARHGAGPLLLQSITIGSLYSAGFGFVDGKPDRPDMAAGVAVQSMLRIFLRQRGPFSWKMRSGMGDVVFSPLYQVLASRGVHFEFFHKVTKLAYDPSTNGVGSIEIEQQAKLRAPYDPLIRVEGVDAWPSAPKCEFLENGDELAPAIENGTINFESNWSPAWKDATRLTLTRGADYDIVVLGISIGALPQLCSEIADVKPAWRDMLREVRTVVTQAQQLWLTPTLNGLGWSTGPAVVQGYPPVLGQWLDASHAIARETWRQGDEPGTILYFCDTLDEPATMPPPSDTGFPARVVERVKRTSREWLDTYASLVWPAVSEADTTCLDYDMLCDSQGRKGVERLDAQYWRANVEPSERYVLSVTGTTKYRLAADQSGVDGLFLTGDWIRNGWNVGCVESTVTSGLQCARAISGDPIEITDEHFFVVRTERSRS